MPDGFVESLDRTGKEQPIADFIAGAIKRPGALTAKAKAAGMSIDPCARQHAKDPGVVGYDSRLYLTMLSKSTLPVKRTKRNASTAEGTSTSQPGKHRSALRSGSDDAEGADDRLVAGAGRYEQLLAARRRGWKPATASEPSVRSSVLALAAAGSWRTPRSRSLTSSPSLRRRRPPS
jgi:hypothetical protein